VLISTSQRSTYYPSFCRCQIGGGTPTGRSTISLRDDLKERVSLTSGFLFLLVNCDRVLFGYLLEGRRTRDISTIHPSGRVVGLACRCLTQT